MTQHARHRARGRLGAALGQWRQPPEFRVPPPQLDPAQTAWVAEVLAEVEAAEALAAAAASSADAGTDTAGTGTTGTADPAAADAGAGAGALVGAATGIWRALRKLDQDAGRLSPADLRQVRLQVRASRQALAEDGLEIQEHDGEPFDTGLSLEALVFQEDPELTREVVLETVRPSVYFRGRRIQMGQVIVGRPPQDPGDETTKETPE
ncbi:hypothetical protein OG946_20750 [Streptomyces sp. NBC_01808]|uniref:hypothetical protein n=1 Tax=Streptomyces sp. NBC_01808 TaxID=2975947 RepID=UPI002DDBD6C9|nr:hypothetical protein [Streptomyces sp. NBC_01808]WSA39578.1 hypothetical protein OG946_20750 [Streptomyces sp. NBC_01808]